MPCVGSITPALSSRIRAVVQSVQSCSRYAAACLRPVTQAHRRCPDSCTPPAFLKRQGCDVIGDSIVKAQRRVPMQGLQGLQGFNFLTSLPPPFCRFLRLTRPEQRETPFAWPCTEFASRTAAVKTWLP